MPCQSTKKDIPIDWFLAYENMLEMLLKKVKQNKIKSE